MSCGATNVVSMPKRGEREIEQIVRTAVEGARRDDVRARAHERRDREMQRRLPAGDRDRADATLQRADALFQHRACRIGNARIDVSRALHVEQRGGVVAVRKNEGGTTGRSASRARRLPDRGAHPRAATAYRSAVLWAWSSRSGQRTKRRVGSAERMVAHRRATARDEHGAQPRRGSATPRHTLGAVTASLH